MINKIVLGTVQFGLNYGINNSIGMPSITEMSEIFKMANVAGINMLDTAHVYGNAESKVGEFSGGNYKVVTKFSKVTNEEELFNEFQISLNNLKTNSVYGYMAHSADTLIQNPELWHSLKKLRKENKTKKIGYSLYSPEQLMKLLDLNLIPDLVQIPYSLLDRKFEVFLPKLVGLGVEIHVRSVFLQGLYFMDLEKLPIKLLPLKSQLQKLHSCCNMYHVEIGSLALNYVVSNPNIDKVVIGIDSSLQLKQNINAIENWHHNQQLLDCVNGIDIENVELLNPANW
jgi:aryl-alcohol dehydrogenase-like predicted oxidoreductase